MTKFEQNVRAHWPDKADSILGLIRGQIDPETYESVSAWVRQCYHRPSQHELIAAALNEVLGGFGVEAHFEDGSIDPTFEYINLGDTYDTTLLYDGRWRVTSWGDYMEAHGL